MDELAVIMDRLDSRTVVVRERRGAGTPRCCLYGDCAKWRRRRRRTFYYPKFGEVFVWICLFNLVNFAQAAPRRYNRSMDSVFNKEASWINPCGNGPIDQNASPPPDESRISDRELFINIEQQSKLALDEAEVYAKDYVESTFKTDIDSHHSAWKGAKYEWLPSKTAIPKSMGEPVPKQHLNTLKADVDLALATIFNNLQRIAVGLEQVDHDQQRLNGPYKQLFSNAKNTLTAVLCEIQLAMTERWTRIPPHITRAIMDDSLRNLTNDSDRNIRDWIIIRDYVNAMEYLNESIKFLME